MLLWPPAAVEKVFPSNALPDGSPDRPPKNKSPDLWKTGPAISGESLAHQAAPYSLTAKSPQNL